MIGPWLHGNNFTPSVCLQSWKHVRYAAIVMIENVIGYLVHSAIYVLSKIENALQQVVLFFCQVRFGCLLAVQSMKEIWLSPMTKAHTPIEISKKQNDNTKTPPKTSITQRLRTDLGRSVEITIATQLVWLNR